MTRAYEGLRVPWVTRWTGDISHSAFSVGVTADGRSVVGYKDEKPEDRQFGFLWTRELDSPTGEPEFAQVSTFRQRASMEMGLCQVCGQVINDRPIQWLMQKNQLAQVLDTTLTFSPPTCARCIPIALRLCPALNRSDYTVLEVHDYAPWGVMGERAWFDENGEVQRASGVVVKIGSPEASSTVAKQLVVELQNYTVREWVRQ